MSRRKPTSRLSARPPPVAGSTKHVTAQGLTSYLSAFHDAYRGAVALVPDEFRERLIRTAFLDLPVIAYVSTQNGVGFEYVHEATETTYRLGSRPVEQRYSARRQGSLSTRPPESRFRTPSMRPYNAFRSGI